MLPLDKVFSRQWLLKCVLLLSTVAVAGHVAYSAIYYVHNLDLAPGKNFKNSFEDSSVSEWRDRGEVEFCCDHSETFIAQGGRHGGQALRINLRKEDPLVAGSKRAELRLKAVGMGEQRWYAFSLMIPDDWPTTSEVVTVAQWHAVDDKILGERGRAPPLRVVLHNDRWSVVTNWDNRLISGVPFLHAAPQGGQSLWSGPIERGVWVDWVFHVKWSYIEDGFVQVWKDGLSVTQYKGPNAYNDLLGPFFKVGIYVPAWRQQSAMKSADQQLSLLVDDIVQSSEPLQAVAQSRDAVSGLAPPSPSVPDRKASEQLGATPRSVSATEP